MLNDSSRKLLVSTSTSSGLLIFGEASDANFFSIGTTEFYFVAERLSEATLEKQATSLSLLSNCLSESKRPLFSASL